MKKLSPEERRIALDAFAPIEPPKLEVLDRSTLERWTVCPFQASAIEDKRVTDGSLATASGQEVHDAISKATRAWIESEGHVFSSHEARQLLITELECGLRDSRPDVQPDVLAGCRASIWAWAKFMSNIHPGNVLAFDGGEDLDRGGQLAIDFPELGVRATSELDLLYTTESPAVLAEVDYKSGHKYHTERDVANAFQFQFHADLVFDAYPHVEALDLTVWDTRSNHRTYEVRFERKRQPEYRARVRKAIETRAMHRNNPPCWSAVEKCELCQCAVFCPAAGEDIKDVQHDPVGSLRQLIAIEAKADALRKQLTNYVDTTGREIVSGKDRFGRAPSSRKPAAKVYQLGKEKE
jgi:hypothetical protein